MLDIAETLNKLKQIGVAPKRMKGPEWQRRATLERMCNEQGFEPVFSFNKPG